MEVGNFKARINMYGISLTKEGKPQLAVNFILQSGEKITFYGSFSENAQERTLKVLAKLGMQAGVPLAQLALGVESNLLSLTQEHEISITKENYNGKDQWKCNVMLDDFDGIRNSVTIDRAYQILGGMNLEAKFNALKSSQPQQIQQPQSTGSNLPF